MRTLRLNFAVNRHGGGGNHEPTFGYTVSIPLLNSKRIFGLDLWLYSNDTKDTVRCVGINNGCRWWHKKYKHVDLTMGVFPRSMFWPVQFSPFGPFMFPVPNKADDYLNTVYGISWPTRCGGWVIEKEKVVEKKKIYKEYFKRPVENCLELYLNHSRGLSLVFRRQAKHDTDRVKDYGVYGFGDANHSHVEELMQKGKTLSTFAVSEKGVYSQIT